MIKPNIPCPVSLTARIVGGKWKPRILYALTQEGTLRFSELRRACAPISERMLSHELKAMEQEGLLFRKQYPVVPPKTEYTLTELGKSLEPITDAMAAWAAKFSDEV